MKVLPIDESLKNSATLHKYDQRILSLLCMNARLPLSKIASLLKLSRQSVEYRIDVMAKHHLIAGSRAVIDIRRLGYGSYHFFIQVSNEDDERKFIERCLKTDDVNALISYSARWNYEVSIMARNAASAQNVFLYLIKGLELGEHFPSILISTCKSSVLPFKEYDLPGRLSLKNIRNDPSFSKQFGLPFRDYKPDEKDLALLYLLSQDAQINLSALGKKVKLSNDAVSYRLKRLILARYILEFRPVIDYSVLGLSLHAVLLKIRDRTGESDAKFKEFLRSQRSVLWATELFGNWDYLLYVLTSSPEEMHEIVNDIKQQCFSHLQSYEVLFAYKEYKYSYMTPGIKTILAE